ncbi:MAG: GDSL-type esterase/lipase family protein [Oscillospiraceae bacterium]
MCDLSFKVFSLPAALLLFAALLCGCGCNSICPIANTQPPANVAFVGDSLTARCDMSIYYPNTKTFNFGINGDSARQVRERLWEVRDASPEAVVLLVGINDLAGAWAQPSDVTRDIADILDDLKKTLPDSRVYVQSIYPVDICGLIALHGSLNTMIKDTNALLCDMCNERGLTYIDVYPSLTTEDGVTLAPEYTEDGVHLSSEGYRAASAVISKSLGLEQ